MEAANRGEAWYLSSQGASLSACTQGGRPLPDALGQALSSFHFPRLATDLFFFFFPLMALARIPGFPNSHAWPFSVAQRPVKSHSLLFFAHPETALDKISIISADSFTDPKKKKFAGLKMWSHQQKPLGTAVSSDTR